MTTPTRPTAARPGYYALFLSLLLMLIGVVLAGGGAWLAMLGGSWYYALAGLALLISGGLILTGRPCGAWVYVALWLCTVVWAVWEVMLDGWEPPSDGWALVPRVFAPTIILMLVLPLLMRPGPAYRHVAVALAPLALLAALAWSQGIGQPLNAQQAELPPAVPETTAPMAQDESAATATEPADTEGVDRPGSVALNVGPEWPAYGGDIGGTRHAPLSQITTQNVGTLEEVWRINTGDMPSEEADGKYSPENTPLMIGTTLYVCSPMGQLIAYEATSGLEIWRYDPQVPVDAIPYGATCRGVAYHAQADADADAPCAARIIYGTLDARLIAVDTATGQLCTDFGQDGFVDLRDGLGRTLPGWYAMTSPPTIVRGVAVVGAQVTDNKENDAPSGVVRGYDAITGDLAWAWDLDAGGVVGEPAAGETYSRGTPNMWTIAAGDEALGLVYLPLGNSSGDYYGSDRSEAENEYATSLVALDAETGEEAWHFQTVYRDVWDYDLGSQITVVDFPADGGTVPALILPTKQGQFYVLNRETGESLFPVEEREVPTTGGVEDDYLSPVQPYSAYASVNKPPLTEYDMWGMSPIDQLWCRIQFRRANYAGEFTPPSADRPWIQYPGYNGGSDWGSVTLDAEHGIIVANYNDMPNYNQLIPREEADAQGITAFGSGEGKASAMEGLPYAIRVNAGWRVSFTGLLCTEPPYGWIRGIELATGDTLWEHPFGSAEKNGPFGLPSFLPLNIGTPNNGGPISTAGGVTFVAATTDDKLRAYATETGEELWSVTLPGGGQTTPITYEAGGRQYVLIYPGGHHFMETPISDAIIAYALPED